MEESKFEKTFWWFWLAGLLLLALQIFLNVWLSNPISPMGIGDHQSDSLGLESGRCA
jgi:HAMP domain-containing protein